MFCIKCGQEMAEGTVFCGHCGSKASDRSGSSAAGRAGTGLHNVRANAAKKGGKNAVLVIIALLLAITTCATGFYSLYGIYAQTGDIITFGRYDWRVLEVVDGKALVISEHVIIKNKAYHSKGGAITWEACDLRKYLNNDFYISFRPEDRARIVETRIENKDNPWNGTSGGRDTTDNIFLLSLDEVVKYFGDSGQLKNRPNGNLWYIDDQYNSERIADDEGGTASWWWLRSPNNSTYAYLVLSDGRIYDSYVYNDSGGVRPALWLNL